MIDPQLSRSDAVVRNLLTLARHDDVLELLCTSLDPNGTGQHVKQVELRLPKDSGGREDWIADLSDSSSPVPMIDEWERLARHAFGDLPEEAAHLAILTGQAAGSLGCDLFLTANDSLLKARHSDRGWVADLGPVTPMELVRMLAVRFRRAGWIPTSSNSTLHGGIYDATVQEWLPAYLPLYRHVCSSEGSARVLDYLDGLLGNCALSLMALDNLACLHFAEDIEPANNTTVAQQQKEAAAFVTAATSTLESLTWVLVILASATPHRRRVTFRKLLHTPTGTSDRRWTGAVSDYCLEAVSALRNGFGPPLGLVVHFRDLLQHHVPIPAGVGMFGDTVRVGEEQRFIERLNVGVLLAEPHPNEELRWPTSDEAMGLLPDAVMPYPFFRSCAFEMLGLAQAVLSCVGSKLDLAERVHPNPHFPPHLHGSDGELAKLLAKAI